MVQEINAKKYSLIEQFSSGRRHIFFICAKFKFVSNAHKYSFRLFFYSNSFNNLYWVNGFTSFLSNNVAKPDFTYEYGVFKAIKSFYEKDYGFKSVRSLILKFCDKLESK